MSKKIIFSIFMSLIIIVIGVGIINVRMNRQLYINILEATDDKELEKVKNDEWNLDYMQNTLDKVENVYYPLEDLLSVDIDLSTYEYGDDTTLVNVLTEPKYKVLYCNDPFEIRLDFPKQTIVFSKEIFTDTFSKVKEINLVKTFEDIFLAIGD
ncbi:hypothetical protein [Clostridium sp. DL1XJH146]